MKIAALSLRVPRLSATPPSPAAADSVVLGGASPTPLQKPPLAPLDLESQKVVRDLQAAGDLGAAYLEAVRDAVPGTTLRDRYQVLLGLTQRESGEYVELPKLEQSAIGNYRCIMSTLREGDRAADVAELYHSLCNPNISPSDRQPLFGYIRAECPKDREKIKALRDPDNWGIYMGARCAQAALQPLGEETQQERLDAVMRIATLRRDSFESEWAATDSALDHYRAVLSSAQPQEKFSDLTDDYICVLRGLVKSHRDPADALTNFHELRTLPPTERPRMRQLLEGVGDMGEARKAADFLDAIPPGEDRDVRVQCATDLVRYLHDFTKARQTFRDVELCVMPGQRFADASKLVSDLTEDWPDSVQSTTLRDAVGFAWRDLGNQAEAVERFRGVSKLTGPDNVVRVYRKLQEPLGDTTVAERVDTFVRLAQVLGPRHINPNDANPNKKAESVYRLLTEVSEPDKLRQTAEQFLKVNASIDRYGVSDEPDASEKVFRDLMGMRPRLPHSVDLFLSLMGKLRDTEQTTEICRQIAQAPCGPEQAEEAMQLLVEANEKVSGHRVIDDWHATMNDRVNNESMPQAARRMAELITPAATDAEQRHQAFTVISRLMERGGTDTATAARYSRLFGSLGTTKGVDEAQALLLQEITPATPPAEREEALVTLAQAELAAQRNRPDEVLEHYRYARDHRLNGEPLTASASRLCELAAVSDSAAAAREACRYISEGDLGTLPVAEATALMVEALRSKRSLEDAMEWVRISVAALRPKQGGTITRGSSHVNLGKIKVPVR